MNKSILAYRLSVIIISLSAWAYMASHSIVSESFKDIIIMLLGSVTGFHSHAAIDNATHQPPQQK